MTFLSSKTDTRGALRCLVFDFDGTLVDSNAIKRQGYFEAAAALGDVGEIVSAVLASCVGDRRQQLTEIAHRARAAGGLADVPIESLVTRYTAYCEERIAVCPAVTGAPEILATLSECGFALYANSATPAEPLRVLLERRGWAHFFRDAFGSPATKLQNLVRISQAAEARPDEILMVGDGEDDRVAARQFGCAFVGIVLESARFAGPADLTLSDLMALPAWLEAGAPHRAHTL